MTNKKINNFSESELIQIEYYNNISTAYDKYFSDPHILQYRFDLYENILKSIDLKNLKVLDAMCGGGQATDFFLKKGAIVTGLDISKNQIDIYKKRYPSSKAICSSILETNFSDSIFNLVVTDSLHHLHPNIDRGIDEIYRILKTDGYLLFWEPFAKSFFDIVRKIWYKIDKKYFEANERSIDLKKILGKHSNQFTLIKKKFGGNFAYLFVQESMALRLNPRFLKFYARILINFEKFLNLFQPSFFSFWVIALLKKK